MNRFVPQERTVSLMGPTQDPLLLLVVSSRRQLKAVPRGMIYSSGSDLRLVLIQFDSVRGHASLHPQDRGSGSLWPPDPIIGTIDTPVHRLRHGVVFVQIN